MATQPIHERFVPMEEYLSTVYEPDCEYDNGVLVERNLGEFEHAYLQTLLATLFTNNTDAWGVFGLTEQRIQINSQKFVVPDVCVLRVGSAPDDILTEPPLIAIEILSPEDTLRRAEKKAAEYLKFGVPYVWVIDPNARVAYACTTKGLELVSGGVLEVPAMPHTVRFEIRISDLFEKLDRIRSKHS